MARTFAGDYADRAYERFCNKRNREAQSKGAGCANSRPPKSKTKIKQEDTYHIDSENQRAGLEFFRKHGELIELRRDGKSLQEIADQTGQSRVGIFRAFQKLPSTKLKLQLGIPT
jgi:hypothetical protein